MMFRTDGIFCHLRLDKNSISIPVTFNAETRPYAAGTLFLSVPKETAIRGISVHVKGKTKLPFDEGSLFSSNYNEEETFVCQQVLASSKKMSFFLLPAGQYEFLFKIPLDGVMLETIASQIHDYHLYHVFAKVERRMKKDIVVSQVIRILRPLMVGFNDILMSQPAGVEGHSKDIMQYSVSIPSTNIPFGSSFPVQFWMAPLSKGLRMESITIEIIENHKIKIQAPASHAARYGVHFLTSRKHHTIFIERYEQDGYAIEGSGVYDIEWETKAIISLPQSLSTCTQRVKSKNINIYHELCFKIDIQDTSGCLSVIHGAFPLNIVILQEQMALGEIIRGYDKDHFRLEYNSPPPLYGKHNTDLIVSEQLGYLDNFAGDQRATLPDYMHFPGQTLYDRVFDRAPSYEMAVGTPQFIGN